MSRSRTRRFVFLVMLVAGVLVPGSPAHACSCAETDLPAWLAPGRRRRFRRPLVDRSEIGEGFAAVTFEVERVVKGTFGPKAIVRTNADGSTCGLELLGVVRKGLLLSKAADGVWDSDQCSQVAPDELLAFSREAPPHPEIHATSAGWSTTSRIIGIGVLIVAAVALGLFVLAWVVRRRASQPGETGVA